VPGTVGTLAAAHDPVISVLVATLVSHAVTLLSVVGLALLYVEIRGLGELRAPVGHAQAREAADRKVFRSTVTPLFGVVAAAVFLVSFGASGAKNAWDARDRPRFSFDAVSGPRDAAPLDLDAMPAVKAHDADMQMDDER